MRGIVMPIKISLLLVDVSTLIFRRTFQRRVHFKNVTRQAPFSEKVLSKWYSESFPLLIYIYQKIFLLSMNILLFFIVILLYRKYFFRYEGLISKGKFLKLGFTDKSQLQEDVCLS
jgi:hypothetical protein